MIPSWEPSWPPTDFWQWGIAGSYTDTDWIRAIRHGVKPDSRVEMFMYDYYSTMSDRDMGDLIAYLKQIPPVDSNYPPTRFGPIAAIAQRSGCLRQPPNGSIMARRVKRTRCRARRWNTADIFQCFVLSATERTSPAKWRHGNRRISSAQSGRRFAEWETDQLSDVLENLWRDDDMELAACGFTCRVRRSKHRKNRWGCHNTRSIALK